MADIFRRFAPSSVGPFARRNYRYELPAAATWPLAVTMIEGSVTGIIADRAFPESVWTDWVVAILATAPAFSNITSLVWARLADGRRTIRNLTSLQLGVIAMVVVMAMAPLDRAGGMIVFAGAAVAARLFMTGVITLRSIMWRADYARLERARITGRLVIIQTIAIAGASLVLGRCMDINPSSFRVIYVIGAMAGLVGVRLFSKIRVRHPFHIRGPGVVGERGRGEGARDRRSPRAVAAGWVTTTREMVRVLREDRAFRGFMMCMFIMGIGNLAVEAPLIMMLNDRFDQTYLTSMLVKQCIPLVLTMLTIPLWARLLDRVHIIRFRSIHSWMFVMAHVLTYFAARSESIGLLAAAQIARGAGEGGGALAWNIGHNDFAPRDQAGTYMTVHVTLTGVRGLLAAYFGVALYSGATVGGWRIGSLGEYSFLFWGLLCAAGAIGFMYLDRRMSHVTGRRPTND